MILEFLLLLALHSAVVESNKVAKDIGQSHLSTKEMNLQTSARYMFPIPKLNCTSNNYEAGLSSHLNGFSNENSTYPPWQYCNSNDQCSCGDVPYDAVKCGDKGTLFVLNCFCVTSDWNKSITELGMCLFNCQHARHGSENCIYRSFSPSAPQLNDALCGKFNRQGSLCGSCKYGYYPLAYSYNMTCVKCEDTWYNWIEYIVIVYLPLTIFYFIILFFQVNTSSHLFGFVLYCQAISFPMMCRILELSYHNNTYYKMGIEAAASLYGIWNLDFFRILNHTTCLRSSFLVLSALDVVSGVYPLLLILLTYVGVHLYDASFKPLRIAIKPFHVLFRKLGESFEIKTSLIDAFSTFYLLSSMKLFNVSYDLLATTKTHILNSTGQLTTVHRLYLDGDIAFFGSSHFPFAILAVIMILLFGVAPTLCFSLYPFHHVQNCLARLPHRWQITLYTFVDTFHGSFKNGTETGSRDCRWFSGVLFAARFLLPLIYTFSFDIMYFVLASMMLALLSMTIAALQPFAENTNHNHLTPSFLLYLSCIYLCLIGGDISTIKAPQYVELFQIIGITMGCTPLLYATILVIYWVAKRNARVRRYLKT